jgi:flavorubredoxin
LRHTSLSAVLQKQVCQDRVELYWGHEEKATRYNKYLIAEPEKALLDFIERNDEGFLG